MRKTGILFFLLAACISPLCAQKQQVVATHAIQIITLQYFTADWEKIKEIKLDIQSIGGWPVVDGYHTLGAYQSMQLNQSGTRLYTFLYDGYQGGDEEEEPARFFTSCYVFDLTTKKGEKLFDIPRSDHVIWQYQENRNSILYYDDSLLSFMEVNLKTFEKLKLKQVLFNGVATQLNATETGFEFIYTNHDSVCRIACNYSYTLQRGPSDFLFGYNDFSSYYNNKLLVLGSPRKGNISFLITPTQKFTANIPFSNHNSFWKDDDHFYIMQQRGLCLYNTRFQLIKSYYLERPHVHARLSNGLLIEYGDHKFAWVDLDLSRLKDIPSVHDNFIQLIAECN